MKEFIRDFVTCPICKKEFSYDSVVSMAIKVSAYDLDLKPEYRGINVSLYNIITCPECCFTFQEKDRDIIIDYLDEEKILKIKKFLDYIKKMDIGEIDNTSKKSLQFYKNQLLIAAEIYSILNLPIEVSKILIKLSWYYRENDETEKELGILYYCGKILEKEFQNTEKEDDYIFCLFYLGYINYRFKRKSEAAKFLDTLLQKYKDSTNPYIKAAKFLRGEIV